MTPTTTSDDTTTPSDRTTTKRAVALLWSTEALAEFDTAERVARAAKDPAFAPNLATRDVTAATADALHALIATARTLSSEAVQVSTDSQTATRTESAERTEVLVRIAEVQAAARQKYALTAPERLAQFGIGARLRSLGFVKLVGVVESILSTLATEALPGITPARVQALQDAIAAYRTADATQTTRRSTASTLRSQRDATLKQIKAARQTIQFAADGAWPYTDPTSAAARAAFLLPASKPFTGGR